MNIISIEKSIENLTITITATNSKGNDVTYKAIFEKATYGYAVKLFNKDERQLVRCPNFTSYSREDNIFISDLRRYMRSYVSEGIIRALFVPQEYATTWTKDKGVLTVSLKSGSNISIDFTTKKILINGNEPKNPAFIPKIYVLDDVWTYQLNDEVKNRRCKNLIADLMGSIIYSNNTNNLSDYEFYLSNLDLYGGAIISPTSFPKGYIAWLKERHETITRSTINKYNQSIVDKRLETEWNGNDKKRAENLSLDIDDKLFLLNNPDIKEIYFKIVRNSANMFEFSSSPYCFIRDIYRLVRQTGKENIVLLDKEKGVETNRKIIANHLDNKKNEILSKQLQRLNFINNLDLDDYIVIVPQNDKDLTKEGEQQNNCVGYYYHDSIRNGDNFIYFIRKKSAPDKSVLTCRYNISSECTAEYRTKNNCSGNQFKDYVNKVDAIITAHLN